MCERSRSQQAPVYTESMMEHMKRFKPPPPPGDSDSWELQFCRWWGWNWVKKRDENETCAMVATASPRRLPRPCDEFKVKKKHFTDLYNCLLFKKRSSNASCPYRNLYRTPSNSTSNINYCGYLKEDDERKTPEKLPSRTEKVPSRTAKVPSRTAKVPSKKEKVSIIEKKSVTMGEKCIQTSGTCTNGMMQASPSAYSGMCKCEDSYEEEGTFTCTSTEGSVEYVTIQHPCHCNCTSTVTEKMDKPIQNVTTSYDCDIQVESDQPTSNCMCEPMAKKSSKFMQTFIKNSDYNVQVGGQYCDCNKRSSNCPCQKNEAQKMTKVGKTQTASKNKEKKQPKIKIYCCHGCACNGCVTEIPSGDMGTTTKCENSVHKSTLVYSVQEPASSTLKKAEKPPLTQYNNSMEPYDRKAFPSVGHISELKSTLSDLTDYNRKLDEVSHMLSTTSEEFRRSVENVLDLSDIEYETRDIDYLDFIPSASSRLMLDVMCDTIMNTENSVEDKTTSMDQLTDNTEEGLNFEEMRFDEEITRSSSPFKLMEAFQTNKIILDKPDISITNIDFFLDLMLKPKNDATPHEKQAHCASPSVLSKIEEQEEVPEQVKCEPIEGSLEKSEKEKVEKSEVKQKNRKKTMLPVRKTVKK